MFMADPAEWISRKYQMVLAKGEREVVKDRPKEQDEESIKHRKDLKFDETTD